MGGTAVQLAELDARAAGYAAASRAPETWRAYRAGYARFARWCAAQTPPLVALPAAPATVARYLAAHADTHRVATLQLWQTAIAAAHRLAGHPVPIDDPVVRTVLAGIRRTHGERPRRVTAATPPRLRAMLAALDPADPRDARDRALLLLGTAAALRGRELVALTLADVTATAIGLEVFIARSKTDQTGRGTVRGVHPGRHPATCPVTAWRDWRRHYPPPDQVTTGGFDPAAWPAFPSLNRWGHPGRALTTRSLRRIVAGRAAAAGLDGRWAGHSLRRGFATAAYTAGVQELAIMRHGRWTDPKTMQAYVEEAGIWADNPTERLGL